MASNRLVDRLRKLPARTQETWQAALLRMPSWVGDEDGPPVRPCMALCVSSRTRCVGSAEPRPPSQASPAMVLEAVVSLATDRAAGGYRPGRLEVRQAEVAAQIGPLLAELGISVVYQAELPALDNALADMTRYLLGGRDDPAALVVPGVTIEHLRGFAEASKEFYEARPWRHLSDEDLIEIVSPAADAGLGWATVMGAGGQTFGLAFFESRRQHERMFSQADPGSSLERRGAWSFTFGRITKLPLGDADAWLDHDLPAAGDAAYPFLGRLGPGREVTRPTPKQWAFVEGLIRALARTSEPEMDSGHWAKTVETAAGRADYVLSLPALLEPASERAGRFRRGIPDRRAMERLLVDIDRATEGMDFSSPEELQRFLNKNFVGKKAAPQPPRTPLERAQDLTYEAAEAGGRRQLQLLREALAISPDCADAYVMLAERTGDPREARDLYAQGVAAGERALGPRPFEEDAGHFWGVTQTRPYMRARFGLAYASERLGQLEEAIGHYEELIRLNPNDNQGVRYRLAGCLLRTARLDPLEELLRAYDDATAHWCYLWALLAFRKAGDGPRARQLLADAHAANRRVPAYLRGKRRLPEHPPEMYSLGDDSEAVMVALEMQDDWKATPGALDWLGERTKAQPRRSTRRGR